MNEELKFLGKFTKHNYGGGGRGGLVGGGGGGFGLVGGGGSGLDVNEKLKFL